jgi:CRISPR-associated protein Cmr6
MAPVIARRTHLREAARGHCSHPGLALARYVAELGDKHAAAGNMRKAVCAWTPDPLYRAAYTRWLTVLAGLDGVVKQVELPVATRMIVGLGSESVLETAIALHHTYGVPFIPGSALKGLAHHYATHHWLRHPADTPNAALTQQRTRELDELFGTMALSGCVAFHDAWYVPGSVRHDHPLCDDGMTPHHPTYYTKRGKGDPAATPTDFDDPNPVGFLSATGKYLVAVQGPNEAWTSLALTILTGALADWGVGAKTSSGYGRLAAPPPPPDPMAESIRALTPEDLCRRILQKHYNAWSGMEEPKKRQVAEAIRAVLTAGGLWERCSHVLVTQWLPAYFQGE